MKKKGEGKGNKKRQSLGALFVAHKIQVFLLYKYMEEKKVEERDLIMSSLEAKGKTKI